MKALRFHPPAVAPTAELRWVLHRAFARADLPVAPPPDPEVALDLADRFDLAARIAARSGPGALDAEIGAVADQFKQRMYFVAANSLRSEATLHEVVDVAKPLSIPLVLLKGGALALLGVCGPGSRSFSDLDILVPLDRIVELRSALVASGWTLSPFDGSEHQEAPLTHPKFGMIELHRCIPGVRPAGSRRSFTADTLAHPGLTRTLASFDDTVRAPVPTILVAHALVHGLIQHGYAPGSYPLFRFLADLQDLGADRVSLDDASRFLRDFDSEDLGALESLLSALESGTALDLPAGAARALLFHLVAGSLDSDYCLGLKSDPRSLRSPSDLPQPLATLRSVYKAVALSRVQVDAIYGPPTRQGGYAARQLLRPFDLFLRLGRSAWARLPPLKRSGL